MRRGRKPGIERLEGRELPSGPVPSGGTIGIDHRVVTTSYQIEVVPMNGSAARGQGRLVDRLHLDGPDAVSLSVAIAGLEPNHAHEVVRPGDRQPLAVIAPGTRQLVMQSSTLGPLSGQGTETLLVCGKTINGTYNAQAPVAVLRLRLLGQNVEGGAKTR